MWRLAEDVDAASADAPPGDGVLLFLRGRGVDAPEDAEVELGWLPLDGRHPLDVLLGLEAPDDWLAAGLTCSGGRVPATAADRRAGRYGSRPAVRVTTVLDRAGRSATVLRTDGRARRLPDVPEGTVGDALRRSLGLPTAPPPESTDELWVAWWLDRVVERSLAGRPPTSWATAASLHPACPFSLPGRGPRPVTLARAAAEMAEQWPWRRLRTDDAAVDLRARPDDDGGTVGPGIPGLPGPVTAGWMDDGMFARCLLGAVPPVPDLLDTCASVLPTSVLDPLTTVIVLSLGPAGTSPGDPT